MSALSLLNGGYGESRPPAAGRDESVDGVASATGSSRPTPASDSPEMLGVERPFAPIG
jgi:hypothetical protein